MPGPIIPEIPFRAVYFDCDSTLSRIEGIDELLSHLPEHEQEELRALTRRAMDGEVALQEVYGKRLDAARPSREQLARLGRLYVEQMVPGAREVIAALLALQKEVGIVSGGLKPAVDALGSALSLSPAHVHAVDVSFDAAGEYAGFDPSSPFARSLGKPEFFRGVATRPLAFVGDGVTDLEAAGEVDLFVGFGGVEARPAVRDGAACCIADANLTPLLDFLLTENERETLERQRCD